MKGMSEKSLDLRSSLKCLFLNMGEWASKSRIRAALFVELLNDEVRAFTSLNIFY